MLQEFLSKCFWFIGKDHCRDSDSSFGLHSPDNLVPGAGQEALQVMSLFYLITRLYLIW